MQIGMIGLGRMGANMARRLMEGGHKCVVFDRSQKAMDELVADGAKETVHMLDLVERLEPPRAVWLSSIARRRVIPSTTGSRASRPQPVRWDRVWQQVSGWPSPKNGWPIATTG